MNASSDCLETLKCVDLMLRLLCRPSSGHILEALHIDPASGVSLDKEKNTKLVKPPVRYTMASWCDIFVAFML